MRTRSLKVIDMAVHEVADGKLDASHMDLTIRDEDLKKEYT